MGIPKTLAQAKRNAVYWDNYVNYLTSLDDRQPNIGQGDPKPPQTELYVKPFALELDTDQYLKANGTSQRWTAYQSSFTGYTRETLNAGSGEIFLNLRNVRPAKVVVKVGMSTGKTVVTARTTKRKYVSRGGTAGSIPFGVRTVGETEVEAYNALRAAIMASGFDTNTMQVSRIREKV